MPQSSPTQQWTTLLCGYLKSPLVIVPSETLGQSGSSPNPPSPLPQVVSCLGFIARTKVPVLCAKYNYRLHVPDALSSKTNWYGVLALAPETATELRLMAFPFDTTIGDALPYLEVYDPNITLATPLSPAHTRPTDYLLDPDSAIPTVNRLTELLPVSLGELESVLTDLQEAVVAHRYGQLVKYVNTQLKTKIRPNR
ncbi:hypothetical protein BJ085DRAFT_33361 [Dimargaris cristalligena]|uniref:Uncharacterized protein n=1 Tax=Dimargaris cristalligena TaxID=215637 RepID=A0A4P9ZR80_9FUNG|nr:hypothetical protein BJ085DRAFT_33361 [Dimargaris cristalligena]|eukprot:RKP36026.1 hypothetical protein BJ085DRAFT_33361 [Dimargaris cristalligena]